MSKALDRWAYESGVTLDFSRPGKPTDNALVESFNVRLRDECLNANWFLSAAAARGKIEAWRRPHKESRPHTTLGGGCPRNSPWRRTNRPPNETWRRTLAELGSGAPHNYPMVE